MTELEELREDRCDRSGRVVENEGERYGRGDGSETGRVKEGDEKKSTTRIDACFTPNFRDKEESNKCCL